MLGVPEVHLGLLGDVLTSASGIRINSDPVFPSSLSRLRLKSGFHELLSVAVDGEIVHFCHSFSPLGVHQWLQCLICSINGWKSI